MAATHMQASTFATKMSEGRTTTVFRSGGWRAHSLRCTARPTKMCLAPLGS